MLLRVEKGESNPVDVKLAVQGLTSRTGRAVTMVDNVLPSEVRAGEIVGIAGVAATGQSETASNRSPASARPPRDGSPQRQPVDVTGNADPAKLRDRGLAHVPEDRHHVGLVLKFESAKTRSSVTTMTRALSTACS